MDTPRVLVVLGVLTTITFTAQEPMAQECRIYHLISHKLHSSSTPPIEVHNLLTVSFYNREEGDFPRKIHIKLQQKKQQKNQTKTTTEMIHINQDGTVFLRNTNFTFFPSCREKSWVTLAVMLQDKNIIIYSTDDRENYISSETSLGPNVTAKVSTALPSLYVHVNCPAGCLVHDKDSPLTGQWLPLYNSVNIYLSHEEGAVSAYMFLTFSDYEGKIHRVKNDITALEPSLWHKLVISHDKRKNVIVTANGNVLSTIMMVEENASFTIYNSSSVLWSFHCYPDHATGLEAWDILDIDNDANNTSRSKESGAGVGQVLAWVLAGVALFLVMIMALLLCTKMNPRSGSTDYGASIGMVTSFGRQNGRNTAEREAEEDTEPDSPSFLAPTIQNKIPEEEDEEQSNTKML